MQRQAAAHTHILLYGDTLLVLILPGLPFQGNNKLKKKKAATYLFLLMTSQASLSGFFYLKDTSAMSPGNVLD